MGWSWWYLLWIPLLIIGALLSQLGEFGHLHYAKKWNFGYAYMFALSFVLFEYLCSISAERGLQGQGFSPMLQYVIWNMFQILFNGLMMVLIFKIKLNGWHIAAYGALAICVVLAAMGDRHAHKSNSI